ncbi:tRNA (adenosine(37)-N6)-threonylcarbamoyltransferase complex dimerization subunit type 1 TsaB [Maricaulis sp. W15]|uniref:tRNA (adenosine(37)-N6)-threonylcarbamoyltransferase complex dimerization subunit type 1 TsaB n=1 Tax=Maricaulis sp. W15 TaxID=1772333 RepID=UPI0009FA55F3|nr:tRNA (adenosine(37)-N6)-threonylcarbamoyltransferase complex dimerization subunit type 1 TsaB [Maricaulis sp. W15]
MTAMMWLAIDTTGENCTVALRLGGGASHVLSDPIGRGHAERLAPMVQQIFADTGAAPTEIARIGVTIGPGSFAGTRVGVAFARGLALACGARCIGIPNLAVLARQAGPQPALAVLHDAKRGEVILQLWTQGEAGPPERCPVADLPARIEALAGSGCKVTGSGAARLPDGFSDLGITTLDPAVLLAMTGELDPSGHPPTPFYARPPDAKLPGGVLPA